jgi:hypothetical protein
MSEQGFRSPDEQSMVEAARQRAAAAYAALMSLTMDAHRANAMLIAQGMTPQPVGEFQPPQAPPTASPSDLVRLFDGQAQWYESEASRIRGQLFGAQSALSKSAEPPAQLAPGPRSVPATLVFAELTRTPWRWMRWLLFPPFAMLATVVVGAASAAEPLAGGAVLALAVTALWVYGIRDGLARVRLLAYGEVGTVLQKTEQYGATRNRNVPMLIARGWTVAVESYSGMSRVTDVVVQTSRGAIAKVKVHHGPPFDGVVLVDPTTGVGRANLDLGSAPTPDANGQWRSSLSLRTWITAALALAMTVGLYVAALAIALQLE